MQSVYFIICADAHTVHPQVHMHLHLGLQLLGTPDFQECQCSIRTVSEVSAYFHTSICVRKQAHIDPALGTPDYIYIEWACVGQTPVLECVRECACAGQRYF